MQFWLSSIPSNSCTIREQPIVIVEEWKTNLMSLVILFHLLCAQHVSDINISIFRGRSKNSNTQRTENKTTDVVIHQHSRRLLKMDILMSETYWAHNKWNKIKSDIKLVFHSSTIAMMYGPINIRTNCHFTIYFPHITASSRPSSEL